MILSRYPCLGLRNTCNQIMLLAATRALTPKVCVFKSTEDTAVLDLLVSKAKPGLVLEIKASYSGVVAYHMAQCWPAGVTTVFDTKYMQ